MMDYIQFNIRVPRPHKSWFRFSVRSGLLLVVLLAFVLGAFRLGRLVGYKSGYRTKEVELTNAGLVTNAYDVADLVVSKLPNGSGKVDFGSLINRIRLIVAPKTWESAGGPGVLAGFEGNLSLVVSQSPQVKRKVADYLGQLRTEPSYQPVMDPKGRWLNQ